MSFGNRGAPSSKRESPNDGEEFARETCQVPTVSKGSGSTLFLIAGAVAVAAIGYVGVASMKSMFAARSASLSAAGAAGGQTGRDGVFRAPLDSDEKIKARLAAACLPKPPTDDNVAILEDALADFGHGLAADELDKKTRMPLADAPNYLSCAARTERQRFCKKSFQEEYANQVTRYINKLHGLGFDFPLVTSMANMEREMQDVNGGKASRGAKVSTGAGGGKLTQDPRIVAAVRDLSRDGLLSKSNFGWFGLTLPTDIAPFLEPPRRKVCP